MPLNTSPNIRVPDDLYEGLLGAYSGLSAEESLRVSARLILLLANHIGDAAVLQEAIEIARRPPSGSSNVAQSNNTP
jgi:Protein of unknown function (DUF2783)